MNKKRHLVQIEMNIEGLTKEEAIEKVKALCDLINKRDPHCKAWLKKMTVEPKEKNVSIDDF